MEKKEATYEMCPHCDNEVELPNTLGVYVCPECGKHIINCSMCLAHTESNADYCSKCCLQYLADKMNGEEEESSRIYNYLYDKAYQPESLCKGKESRKIYCNFCDDVPYNEGKILIVDFKKNDEINTDIQIVYENMFGNIMCMETRLDKLSKVTINKLIEIVDRPEETYSFSGNVYVKINKASVKARTRAEADRMVRTEIEKALTTYGEIDTEVDFLGINIH